MKVEWYLFIYEFSGYHWHQQWCERPKRGETIMSMGGSPINNPSRLNCEKPGLLTLGNGKVCWELWMQPPACVCGGRRGSMPVSGHSGRPIINNPARLNCEKTGLLTLGNGKGHWELWIQPPVCRRWVGGRQYQWVQGLCGHGKPGKVMEFEWLISRRGEVMDVPVVCAIGWFMKNQILSFWPLHLSFCLL